MNTNYTSYQQISNRLKILSSEIKSNRNLARQHKLSGHGYLANQIHNKLRYDQCLEFRILHIAYCELHGKTREQIEKKFRHDEWWTPYINSKVKEIKLSLSVNMNAINSGN